MWHSRVAEFEGMGGTPSLPNQTDVSCCNRGYVILPFRIPASHPAVSINLAGNKLQILPRRLANVKYLILDSNGYEHIPKMVGIALRSYRKLVSLSVNKNRLVDFDVPLEHLETLNIVRNCLTEFPPIAPRLVTLVADCNMIASWAFSAERMTRLSFGQNMVKEIDPSIRMPMLDSLDAKMNELERVPPNLAEMFPKLRSLNLSFNKLTSFETQLPPELRILDISFNAIEALPEQISELANLKVLNFEHNKVKRIPKLPSGLETLIVSENLVEETVPSEFTGSLKLICYDNSFREIPEYKCICDEYLFGYNSLTQIHVSRFYEHVATIDLSFSNIETVPAELFKLGKLRRLFLQANKIKEIPPEFTSSAITLLDISHNEISVIPKFPSVLETLYASYNKIEDINNLCEGCILLHTVDLCGNRLKRIPKRVMVAELLLSNNRISKLNYVPDVIRQLDLSMNKISELPEKMSYMSLRSVDLSHNRLTAVPHISAPSLQFYKIAGNQISEPLDLTGYRALDTVDITNTGITQIQHGEVREILTSMESPEPRFRRLVTDPQVSGYAEMLGTRKEMEDSIAVRDDMNLYILCDGHGGSTTSTYAVNQLVSILSTTEARTEDQIRQAIIDTNNLIVDQNIKGGATLAMAAIQDKNIVIAHMGDSRVLVTKDDGTVRFATTDHKPYNYDEWRRIANEGGYVAHLRINADLSVSRGFGDNSTVGVGHTPDITTLPIEDNDRFIIIGCDGVFDVVPNEAIAKFAAHETSPVAVAYKVRNLAFSCGSQDNISVIVRSLKH